MLSAVFLVAGSAILSVALRSFAHPAPRKLGAIGLVATSFLLGWLFTGYVIIGLLCASTWFLLPWVEIFTRVRHIRLPEDQRVRQRTPPSADHFPALEDLTAEIEREGFAHAEDAGWDWDEHRQFYRLFYKEEERAQAAICLIDQDDFAFFYISLSSRAPDGRIWTTWNYPFSYTLKLHPGIRLHRIGTDTSFADVHDAHGAFLLRENVGREELARLDPTRFPALIRHDLRKQIRHNIAAGVLKKAGGGKVRYSWRGFLFLWVQILRDLVRLS